MHIVGGALGKNGRWAYFMPMDDLRISLSAQEYAFLDAQATSEGHASAEDYAAAVIRAELKAKAQEKLEALLVESLDEDGADEAWSPKLIAQIRTAARRAHG
jgi:hypothetical protein